MKTTYRRNTHILTKLIERAKICLQDKDGCWDWTAGKDRCGYGRIWHENRNRTAHTVAYEVFVGVIPKDMHVRHSCDNPLCINPSHFLLGTHTDNMHDKATRKRVSGQRNPNAKYSDEARELARTWKGSPSELAKQTGMSASYICNLRKGHA